MRSTFLSLLNKRNKKIVVMLVCDSFHYRLDNMSIRSDPKLDNQVIGITMATNGAPLGAVFLVLLPLLLKRSTIFQDISVLSRRCY